ncbi:CIA30 family protein [Colwellia sp. D2M02]|uniref:CIA30 family protein n=1 Tax=Colwellia sp. D2M02 TaxID=2841562 RepID=UPI001C09E24B|nr:CIA30 family protein [Colwellia sp. D2M02]MBU2892823.1 CIA30 family protein [Colwellia sp. D2M02]
MLINFTESNEINYWRVSNDSVMGGASSSLMLIEGNYGRFFGNISRDNNGGFSSVYRRIESLTSGVERIRINSKGDGQTYQVRIMSHVDGYRVAYRHNFVTLNGIEQQFSFKLADFIATFRGRLLPNAPKLTAESVQEVGFLMTKKKPGKFALIISNIEFS